MLSDLPKVAPDCVTRNGIGAWLEEHGGQALRVIAAQPGAGKTTAVAQWARSRADQVAWITVTAGATASDLCAQLLCALAPNATISLSHALRTTTVRHVVLDNADAADARARALLSRLYLETPEHVGFIYLVRSRSAVDLLPGTSAGVVAMLDGAALRFDEDELARLTATHAVDATPAQRRRLLNQTGGWAIATAGAVRYAAAVGAALETAFERWLATSRTFVDDLVGEALGSALPSCAQTFHRLLTGEVSADDAILAELAEGGLFVDQTDGVFRLNPVVTVFERRKERRPRLVPALLHMFGRFCMTIGTREVEFIRRRDRQIVQFLALRPDGAATRSELIEAFWPDGEQHVAAQALRSACTTIRRSLAECAGRANVAAYFKVEGNVVQLCHENVASNARRFKSHVELAAAAETREAFDAAYAHWSAALAIHAAALLAGEPPAPWIAAPQRAYERLAHHAAERARVLAYVEMVDTGQVLTA